MDIAKLKAELERVAARRAEQEPRAIFHKRVITEARFARRLLDTYFGEDEKCEWRWSGTAWGMSCCELRTDMFSKHWAACPFCGRPIKEVE